MLGKVNIILFNNQVLLRKKGKSRHLLSEIELNHVNLTYRSDSIKEFCIGEFNGVQIDIHILVSIDEIVYDQCAYEFVQSKPYMDILDEKDHPAMLRALHLNNWHYNTKYCGKCGEQTQITYDESFAKLCQQGHKIFLAYSPAIVVMITRKNIEKVDEILLVRKPTFPSGLYTHVAGFVDPGESFEEAVIREVKEETGVSVSNVEYFGDQSWPFPSGHMIGFRAKYSHGDILITDTDEIEDVKWFSREELKKVRNPIGTNFSISNKLTTSFLNNYSHRRHYSTSLVGRSIPENFIIGASGLGAAYPFLRLSIFQEHRASAVTSLTWRQSYHRGMMLVSMQAFFFALGCFALNKIKTKELITNASSNLNSSDKYPAIESLWPIAFGIMASLSYTPFENIAYRNDAIRKSLSNNRHLKQGFSGTSLGIITYAGLGMSLFSCYPYAKKQLGKQIDSSNSHFSEKFLAGLGTGFGVSLVNQPFNLFRTHQQVNTNKSQSFLKTTKHIFRKDGIKGFYRGLLPRTFWFATVVAVSDHASEKAAPKINKFFNCKI